MSSTKVIGDSGSATSGMYLLFSRILPIRFDRFRVQHLVLAARGGATAGLLGLDLLRGPGLATAGGRLRVVHAVLCPLEREPRIEDAARVERRLGLVDHRESGVMAARLGGWCWAVKSWLMPP